MSLLDEARAAMKATGPQCSVATWLTAHAELRKEAADLFAAVKAKTIHGSVAAATLREHGWQGKGETVLRHVNGGCACH